MRSGRIMEEVERDGQSDDTDDLAHCHTYQTEWDSDQSGDESENELWSHHQQDDVDASPFTKLYNRLIGKYGSHTPARPQRSPKQENQNHDNIYDFSNTNRGLAVIVNNEKFHPRSKMSVRHGSHYDANDLELVFKKMGFRVKRYNDLTGAQMVLKLKKIAANIKYDHTKADCFACAILSHGEAVEIEPDKPPYDATERLDVLFGVDGVIVPTRYILSLFNDRHCPELEGKPRMFFIQACRGSDYDDGVDLRVWKTKTSQGKTKHHDVKDEGPTKVQTVKTCNVISTQQQINSSDSTANSNSSDSTANSNSSDSTANSNSSDSTANSNSSDSTAEVNSIIGTTSGNSGSDIVADITTGVEGCEMNRSKHDMAAVQTSEAVIDDMDAGIGNSNITISPSPIYKDFLVMYSCPPGYFAWRRSTGAWFIQSLKRVLLSSDLTRTSLTQLLTRVTRLVAIGYQSQGSGDHWKGRKKQVPCRMSMLTKDIYFTTK